MTNDKINIIVGQFSLILAFSIVIINFLYLGNQVVLYIVSSLLFGLSVVYNIKHLKQLKKEKTGE